MRREMRAIASPASLAVHVLLMCAQLPGVLAADGGRAAQLDALPDLHNMIVRLDATDGDTTPVNTATGAEWMSASGKPVLTTHGGVPAFDVTYDYLIASAPDDSTPFCREDGYAIAAWVDWNDDESDPRILYAAWPVGETMAVGPGTLYATDQLGDYLVTMSDPDPDIQFLDSGHDISSINGPPPGWQLIIAVADVSAAGGCYKTTSGGTTKYYVGTTADPPSYVGQVDAAVFGGHVMGGAFSLSVDGAGLGHVAATWVWDAPIDDKAIYALWEATRGARIPDTNMILGANMILRLDAADGFDPPRNTVTGAEWTSGRGGSVLSTHDGLTVFDLNSDWLHAPPADIDTPFCRDGGYTTATWIDWRDSTDGYRVVHVAGSPYAIGIEPATGAHSNLLGSVVDWDGELESDGSVPFEYGWYYSVDSSSWELVITVTHTECFDEERGGFTKFYVGDRFSPPSQVSEVYRGAFGTRGMTLQQLGAEDAGPGFVARTWAWDAPTDEAEVLYPPLTFLEPTGRTQRLRTHGFNFHVIEVKPQIA